MNAPVTSVDLLTYLHDALNLPLFSLGTAKFTVGSLGGMLIAILALMIATRWLQRWMMLRLERYGHMDLGTRETVASLSRYLFLAIGLTFILDSAGIKLSSFTVLAGALGVGVGFGLQNIFSNFISGLIVMFERPVKVGDHVVVAGVEGDVVQIGMRATTLRTPQDSVVIIPNQSLITGNVVNWSTSGIGAVALTLRLNGKVEEEEALLLKLLNSHPDVQRSPQPQVYLMSMDHAGHVIELHFRVAGDAEQRLRRLSNIQKAALAAVTEAGWAIAANP